MPKLSVTVVAKNEAADLGAALASVAWADEIVVVDSHSTDETVAIARQYTDRVVVHDWLGHIEQKNYAASLASHDWILSLDADERVTPALADEIRSTLTPDPAARRLPHPARDVASRPLGAHRPTGIPTIRTASTTGAGRGGPVGTCTRR